MQILAAAYELSASDVEQDAAVLDAYPWSGLEMLDWLRRRHVWQVETCVYYLAALRRAQRGQPPVL